MMDVTGFGDGRRLKCGAPIIDCATGLTAAFAISAALFQREREGCGQHIDVSMLEMALTLTNAPGGDFLQSGRHPHAKRNRFIARARAGWSLRRPTGRICRRVDDGDVAIPP